jgi:hypothetical protein
MRDTLPPLTGLFIAVASLVLGGCHRPGPILDVEGPIDVAAHEVTYRGGDTDSLYRVRILNLLKENEGICEINIRGKTETRWSDNQIVRPNTCFVAGELVSVALATGGEWALRIKTSTGRVDIIRLAVSSPVLEIQVPPIH